MSFLSDQFKGLGQGLLGTDVYLRDYRHAAKTFRSKSYAYAPKLKFLFHTYFNINNQAWPEGAGKNFGILVKEVKLPSYQFKNSTLNQYNRKRIVQTKVNYDPVTITFHDDNTNNINKLWYAYFTYYYADANKSGVQFTGNRGENPFNTGMNNAQLGSQTEVYHRNIYKDQVYGATDWGLTGEAFNMNTTNDSAGLKVPFFKDITIFGFNQHQFTAYTLVNPIISGFNHDTYNYAEGNGVMQNTMTLEYETVAYNEGSLAGEEPSNIVTGFGLPENYDRKTSPIMQPGANNTILGPGGLVDGAGGVVKAFQSGNLFGAGLAAARTYKNLKNTNLASTAKYELLNMQAQSAWEFGSPIVRNRNLLFDIPNKSVTPYTIGTAGAPTIAPPETQNVTAMPYKTPVQTAGTQVTNTPNLRG